MILRIFRERHIIQSNGKIGTNGEEYHEISSNEKRRFLPADVQTDASDHHTESAQCSSEFRGCYYAKLCGTVRNIRSIPGVKFFECPVMVHSSSNVKEPVRQGMWGIFEVFADTMVVCTLTAFAVLSSGLIDLDTGAVLVDVSGSALVGQAFATVFGSFGPAFIAIAILLFAFSTVLGWSHYGSKACEYLFGTKSTIVYKVVFVLMIFIGCTMNLGLAWDLSDTFNGLMAIPNLIGVIALSPVVMKITQNYVARIIKKEDVKPMLSVFPEIQEEQEKAM